MDVAEAALIVQSEESHEPVPEERLGKISQERNYKQKGNKMSGLLARLSKADGTVGCNSCN